MEQMLVDEEKNIHWQDLPQIDVLKATFKHDYVDFKTLFREIDSYHNLSKSILKNFPARMASLSHIYDLIDQFLNTNVRPYLERLLRCLQNLILRKKNYLRCLMDRHQQGLLCEEQQIQYFKNIAHLNPDKAPLFLINTCYYDAYKAEYWGKYWLEAIDPCHRQLSHHFLIWDKEQQKGEGLIPFFLWLEDKFIPNTFSQLTFLSLQQKENLKPKIINGDIYIKDEEGCFNLFHTKDHKNEFIFVIDGWENFYLCEATKTVRHISLSAGLPILGAGILWANHGQVSEIAISSGHYLPTLAHGLQALEILQDRGLYFHSEVNVHYYIDFQKHTTKYSQLRTQIKQLNTYALQ